MSDYISCQLSTLELLPDELLLEMFAFVRPIDLFLAFLNLNSRLNAILRDVRIRIHIVDNEKSEEYQMCMNYFAPQVVYLAISCHWSCLSYNISLLPFVNLRSLHLPMPSEEQFHEIIPVNLPLLINLTINNSSFSPILLGSDPFPHLVSCRIPRVSVSRVYAPILHSTDPLQACLSLRLLHLWFCSLSELFKLLKFVPNLTYLEVVLTPTMANVSMDHMYLQHKNLSHLKVRPRKLDPELKLLLNAMPCLHRLELIWNEGHRRLHSKGFDFQQLADILESNSHDLIRVDVDVRLLTCDHRIEDIRRMSPRWFSTLAMQESECDDSVYISARKSTSNNHEQIRMNMLQSTYITERNTHVNRSKIESIVCFVYFFESNKRHKI